LATQDTLLVNRGRRVVPQLCIGFHTKIAQKAMHATDFHQRRDLLLETEVSGVVTGAAVLVPKVLCAVPTGMVGFGEEGVASSLMGQLSGLLKEAKTFKGRIIRDEELAVRCGAGIVEMRMTLAAGRDGASHTFSRRSKEETLKMIIKMLTTHYFSAEQRSFSGKRSLGSSQMVAELLPNNETRGDRMRTEREPIARVLWLKYGFTRRTLLIHNRNCSKVKSAIY
jgi:hypothetical protein